MPKLDKLYAFVADDNGPEDQGIMAFRDGVRGGWMPMVGGDLTRIDQLYPIAKFLSGKSGIPFKVMLYGSPQDVTAEVVRRINGKA